MEFISRTPSWGIDLPELYFDAGTTLGENIGTYGWVIRDEGEVIRRGYGAIRRSQGNLTSHYAEFVGAIKGLQTMLDLGYDRVRVKGDNIHVLGSLERPSNWDDPQIQQGADLARRLFHSFSSIKEVQKIHRSENSEADALARDAFAIYQDSSEGAEVDPILNHSEPTPSKRRRLHNPVKSIV
ncbi:reverse transcriptase-like protein [Halodesulfurarchaeum sp. HSR-GB]|uniref:reverse transcriptase-like protein n=1 Tax=Halodesulfurarchaeum sp. HSR-GB TaxID=3074077 RepID=UPI00286389A6|nr:reverse transcriptase-like protein [Halodesulfurarchaeum sp. HSR-GB]MDR5657637.1 reverse transcriptase-like protein [Halodesulfurarchaeum sp. HSR-GB]